MPPPWRIPGACVLVPQFGPLPACPSVHELILEASAAQLVGGRLQPFFKAVSPRFLLASDLDGTMIENSEDAWQATRAFRDWWESTGVLANGVLVYNTGRSLGAVKELLETHKAELALPDILISAVGTKIFRLDTEGGTRATASGTVWIEDEGFARMLDAGGWDLETGGCGEYCSSSSILLNLSAVHEEIISVSSACSAECCGSPGCDSLGPRQLA